MARQQGRVEVLDKWFYETADGSTGSEAGKGEPVVVPRGEAKVARRLASAKGASKVALKYKGGGRVSYFDSKGRRLKDPGAMMRWLVSGKKS